MKKRSLSMILAALMMLSLLGTAVACGTPVDDGTAPVGTDSSKVEETETESPYSQLEKEQYNRDFTVLIRDDCVEDFVVEKMTGELLNDSLYERNTVISEDYGVKFVFQYQGFSYSGVNEAVKQQVNGNLDEYDMFIGHKSSYAGLAMNNYLYDLGKITSMELSSPWWDQAAYENLTVAGKTYVMTGDINPSSSMRITSCMVVNKDMMTELHKDMNALNELTENGGWTLDVLHEYAKDVTFDLNGDQKISYQDDRYCLTGWMMAAPYALYYGTDGSFVKIVDGIPELNYTDEMVLDTYAKIYAIMIEQNAYYVTQESQYTTMFDVFSEGRALFSVLTLKLISQYLSEMENSYGILPVPKYDQHQQDYASFVNGSTGLVMVAKTEKDTEFVGAIMDAMACYNYEHVTPNMFQVVTKLQVAQDPASARMVDLIIRNRVFDLGYFADLTVTNLVKDSLNAKRAEISSSLKSARRVADNALTKLLTNMDKFD